MRSWRCCVNPARIAIAPLTAILAATAAVSAVAAAKDDGVACDERSLAPDDATLRIGRAIGTGRIRVFGGTAAIAHGQALLLGASRPGYVCALFANGLEARAGWVPQAGVAPATLSMAPAPRLPPGSGRGGNTTTRSSWFGSATGSAQTARPIGPASRSHPPTRAGSAVSRLLPAGACILPEMALIRAWLI